MDYLLDTHVILWMLSDEASIPPATRQLLKNVDNCVFFSVVSIWEISIKRGIGKLKLSKSTQDIVDELIKLDINPIPVVSKHALLIEQLPEHHSDPFDRLIIAQAIAEDKIIVSRDRFFSQYPVAVRWH